MMYRSFALLVALGVGTVWGCGADHGAGVDIVDQTPTGAQGGEGGELPWPVIQPCRTGEVRDCTVYYTVGSVESCFVGVELCVDGGWETCTEQERVDERLAELEALGLLEPGEPSGAAGAGGAVGR